MNEERIGEIGKKVRVFSFRMLQDLVTLSILLEREEISFKELKKYLAVVGQTKVKILKRREKFLKSQRKEWDRKTRKCPKCGSPLLLRAITTPEGRGNTKGYNHHWFCSNDSCLFEEYGNESFEEKYKEVIEGR